MGSDAGTFIRVQFPSIGHGPTKVTQEEVDTFETILAQCTAFLERAPPPNFTPYNPSEYRAGEGYVSSGAAPEKPPRPHGQIVSETVLRSLLISSTDIVSGLDRRREW